MLLIPTYLAKSKIHGTGVYTATPVAKGTPIWVFDPSVDQSYTDSEFNRMVLAMPALQGNQLRSWAYKENGNWILCGDNAKFFNHNEINPTANEKTGVMSVANRDLQAGEELTCNYKDFDDNDKLVEGPLYP